MIDHPPPIEIMLDAHQETIHIDLHKGKSIKTIKGHKK